LIKVLHVVTGLNVGGSEMMLYRFLSRSERTAFEHRVISLIDVGTIGEKIRGLGVTVRALGMTRGVANPIGLFRLAHWLRQDPPAVMQTWSYHSNLIGGIAAKMAGRLPVVWGLRTSNPHPKAKRTTLWTARACARLSCWLPTRIVSCSDMLREVHKGLGYPDDKTLVIPNGVDTQEFVPSNIARAAVRAELGISDRIALIGLIARFDLQKNHQCFIAAAAMLSAQVPDIHFLLCGRGIEWTNQTLAGWIRSAGIENRCHLLGPREDIPQLMAALDIAALSSSGEGFPNVVIEAMACGIPCAVTDVGGCSFVVGDTGRVVPTQDSAALARALGELVELGSEQRNSLGVAARRRVEEHFSLDAVVTKYQDLYQELASEDEGGIANCAHQFSS